jgi:predicted outer membrane repeat protein
MRLFPRRFTAFASARFMITVCLGLATVAIAQGATLVVTSTADSGAGSLRDTIAAAADGDTIQFDPALNGETVSLSSGELVINKNMTISGPGPNTLTVSRVASAPFRIFHILPGHTITLAGLTISRGDADESGFGIRNEQSVLTIDNCIVRDNQPGAGYGGDGAGVYNYEGTLKVQNSTIAGNFAFVYGGYGTGGGICSTGTLEISHSTIFNNTAFENGGGIACSGSLQIDDSIISSNTAGLMFGYGGGIVHFGTGSISNSTVCSNRAVGSHDGFATGYAGGISNGGILTITNSTISGNSATADQAGIYNGGGSGSSTLVIRNSTISDNTTNGRAGGIYNLSNGAVRIGNTIIKAGNSGANIRNNGGTVISDGYNLSSDDAAGFFAGAGDQINTNPILGPLQNNGGPTLTHLPLSGSPAINAGDPTFNSDTVYDQRGPGYARVFNGRLDIGSVEVQPTPIPTPTATPSPTPSLSPTPTATATSTPTPTPTVTPPSLGNISTRLRVETRNNVLIGGFIISGNTSKDIVLRGIGPSLGQFGLSPILTDPILELRGAGGTLIFQNDDWQENSQQAAQLSALGLAPQNQKESGIVATLAPAAYTAILAGKNGDSGIGAVEIYDTNHGNGSQLANISTRGLVQTGDNVMIGGFILGGGSGSNQIVVRGIGPSLSQFGLSPVLTDPTLELRNADGVLLISNNDWQDDSASAAQLISRNLAPQNPKESGSFSILPPGGFTAILGGVNGGTGIGLVEIYNVH